MVEAVKIRAMIAPIDTRKLYRQVADTIMAICRLDGTMTNW